MDIMENYCQKRIDAESKTVCESPNVGLKDQSLQKTISIIENQNHLSLLGVLDENINLLSEIILRLQYECKEVRYRMALKSTAEKGKNHEIG